MGLLIYLMSFLLLGGWTIEGFTFPDHHHFKSFDQQMGSFAGFKPMTRFQESGNRERPFASAASSKKKEKKKEEKEKEKEGKEKEEKREVTTAEDHLNEVKSNTRKQFIAPKIKDPKKRHEKYQRKAPVGDLGAAQFVADEEPFFETFDHATTILGLQSQRKAKHIPFLKLQSIRPYFPFFVKD